MLSGRSYTDPETNIERVVGVGQTMIGTVSTTGTYCHYAHPQAATLYEVRATVAKAGTVDEHVLEIFKGASSLGTMTMGTNVLGVKVDASLTDTTLEADDVISVKKTADNTGISNVFLVLKDLPA